MTVSVMQAPWRANDPQSQNTEEVQFVVCEKKKNTEMSSNVKSQIEDIEKESRLTGYCTRVQKHCFLMFCGTLSYSPWQEEPVQIALFNQQSFNEQSMVVPRQGRHPQVNFAQYQIPLFFPILFWVCAVCVVHSQMLSELSITSSVLVENIRVTKRQSQKLRQGLHKVRSQDLQVDSNLIF